MHRHTDGKSRTSTESLFPKLLREDSNSIYLSGLLRGLYLEVYRRLIAQAEALE